MMGQFKWIIFATIGCLVFFYSENVFSQFTGQNSQATRGMRNAIYRIYDVNTVETVYGELLQVEQTQSSNRSLFGIHILLKTDSETLSVHLGPAWFVETQNIDLTLHTMMEITGSRIIYNGQPAIVAAQVLTGNNIVNLRDESGMPLWSGGRRR